MNPCIRCGCIPRLAIIGSQHMYKCPGRPRGCGTYVYGATLEEAAQRWNERNPKPTKETP